VNLRIYKYPLRIADEQAVPMPAGARILSVQDQDGQLCVWALVDADVHADTRTPMPRRTFYIVGTGHPLPEALRKQAPDPFTRVPASESVDYVGTVQHAGGSLVWHVFASGA
jgi:hypothetical protein